MRYFRYAAFSLTALLVLSLGFALIPPEPPAPAEPPFSEQARAAALEEALRLRSAGRELGAAGGNVSTGGTAAAPMDQVVTLLTFQARALLLPDSPASAEARASATATATASLPAGAPPTVAPPSSAPPAQVTVAGFAAALAASGQQRLKDAETADGGIARLLAGSGIAQLLAAEQLGAKASPSRGDQGQQGMAQEGTAQEGTAATPGSTEPSTLASACPSAPPVQADANVDANAAEGTVDDNGVSVGTALVAAAEAELETVYGYQAALTRLPPEAVRAASDHLKQHQDLADQAATISRLHCGTPAPQPPGYVLDQEFLDAPAAGLARLEADTLPAYGDIVAITDGSTRAWALSALQGGARRAQHWGAGPDPLPGLVLDEAQLPPLPG